MKVSSAGEDGDSGTSDSFSTADEIRQSPSDDDNVTPKQEPLASVAETTEPESEADPSSPSANTVMIMGFAVDFPQGKQPFPAQLAVMNKALQALKNDQHALLESPTGSGKTLALLCSSLTFQRHVAAELEKEAQEQRRIAKEAHAAKVEQAEQLQREAEELARENEAALNAALAAAGEFGSWDEHDSDGVASSLSAINLSRFAAATTVFADGSWMAADSNGSAMKRENSAFSIDDALGTRQTQPNKKLRVLPPSLGDLERMRVSTSSDEDDDNENLPDLRPLQLRRSLPAALTAAVSATSDDAESSISATQEENFIAVPAEAGTIPTPKAPPKIFFCSRTHSQLAQVIDELKNCPVSYLNGPSATNPFARKLRMCVLGSKARFCVNKDVNSNPSEVADACSNLMSVNACSFGNKQRKKNDLKGATPQVWNIEDMLALSEVHKECGYFYSREELAEANIVFCPYIYILEPGIRSAMSIYLNNAIVIFDEAHNVEDTCRSSASLELEAELLAVAIALFTRVLSHDSRSPAYHSLLGVLEGLNRWVQGINANASAILRPTGVDEESKVWTGGDALLMLAEFTGITESSFGDFQVDLEIVEENEKQLAARGGQSQTRDDARGKQATSTTRDRPMLLGMLALNVIRSLFNVIDYMLRDKLKYLDDFKLVIQRTRKQKTSSRRSSRSRAENKVEWELKMCIWCLSARVAFSDVVKAARSVILTSGTLSPMDSFAGELGTDFPVRLEANHVVDMRKQVFAGAVMRGPGGVDLSSTYAHQQEIRYQDSMGELLLQFAMVVPGGILMFFPSYSFMEKLKTRWRRTGQWSKINDIKFVYSEPRKAGKKFDALLDKYKYAVARGRAGTAKERTGAVFLAVYRGKVSEGIDFSNDNARAVLAVGIPFPSVADLHISLKRRYQDEMSRLDKKLVNGQRWYQLQAFRALNQALGRCIRHRKDYGAILLLDSRYRDGAHTSSISKWMRGSIQEVERSELVLSHFLAFFRINEQVLGTGAEPLAVLEARRRSQPLSLEYESSDSEEEAPTAASLTPTPTPATENAEVSNPEVWLPRVINPRVRSVFRQGLPAPQGSSQATTTDTAASQLDWHDLKYDF